MLLRVAQVVYTVTQARPIERVAFKLDGEPVSTIGGEGIIVSPPVARADFKGQAPAILVERPYPGEVLVCERGSVISVAGTANVPDGRFNLEVRDPAERIILSRSIKVSRQRGIRRNWLNFDEHLQLEPSRAGTGTFIFFDTSEKDGSRVNVVEIPVRMKK